MPRQAWPRSEQLDSDDRGPIPAVNVSVKISALFSQIKAEAPEDSIERLCERMRPLLRRAKARDVFINFDMEMHSLKDLTLRLFKTLLEAEEFSDFPHAGIAIQAYLRETPDDVEQLIEWATKRRTRVTVRLVKGAYWDTETILARQRRWPMPVYEQKQETDAAYERVARRLLENSEVIDCAFGTHNVRTIAACLAEAKRLGLPSRRLEFQMLYGMAEPDQGGPQRDGVPCAGILSAWSRRCPAWLTSCADCSRTHPTKDFCGQNSAKMRRRGHCFAIRRLFLPACAMSPTRASRTNRTPISRALTFEIR